MDKAPTPLHTLTFEELFATPPGPFALRDCKEAASLPGDRTRYFYGPSGSFVVVDGVIVEAEITNAGPS